MRTSVYLVFFMTHRLRFLVSLDRHSTHVCSSSYALWQLQRFEALRGHLPTGSQPGSSKALSFLLSTLSPERGERCSKKPGALRGGDVVRGFPGADCPCYAPRSRHGPERGFYKTWEPSINSFLWALPCVLFCSTFVLRCLKSHFTFTLFLAHGFSLHHAFGFSCQV